MAHSRENSSDGDHEKPLCLISIGFPPAAGSVASSQQWDSFDFFVMAVTSC
jgi:hypothetical protein